MKLTFKISLAAFLWAVSLSASSPAQDNNWTAAVMTLNLTGLAGSDAEFLTERLMIELQRAGGLEVMERNQRDQLLKERQFQKSGSCDAVSCLVEAGRLLAVQKIVGGSIGKIGQVISVQVRLVDLGTGAVERTAVRDYSGDAELLLTRGMREVALELMGRLGAQPRDTSQTAREAVFSKPEIAAKKIAREKPSSTLKAPQLTYGSLALSAGFGALGLISLRQAKSYNEKDNRQKADAYRSQGKAALAAASGCAAVCLISAFFKGKPSQKDRR
jgi:TolB-like protein